ncbi:hypothetical protein SAMN03159448_06191 [Sinorhizobium sp. NFACC03]|nr:hypothetical protein SAMN03159448_06191 [Sinorhizobium sp. NFACC03]
MDTPDFVNTGSPCMSKQEISSYCGIQRMGTGYCPTSSSTVNSVTPSTIG